MRCKILIIFIFIIIINISFLSALCEKIYEKGKDIDFYIFLDTDYINEDRLFKEAFRINNYVKHFKPYKEYKFAYYYEQNIGDCSHLIDCNSLGVKIIYKEMRQQGYATARKVDKTNYQLVYLNPRYINRHLVLHELAHAIGNLKDLDRIKDKRDKDSKTLMHYGSYSYHLADWQIEDIKENIIESKRWCRINKYD
jgi:hypothetical protein